MIVGTGSGTELASRRVKGHFYEDRQYIVRLFCKKNSRNFIFTFGPGRAYSGEGGVRGHFYESAGKCGRMGRK